MPAVGARPRLASLTEHVAAARRPATTMSLRGASSSGDAGAARWPTARVLLAARRRRRARVAAHPRRRHPRRRRGRRRAWSPAATTAASSATPADGEPRDRSPTRRAAGSTRSPHRRRARVAWSTGKRVHGARRQGPAADAGRRRRRAQGLAFAPKGYRLAVSHYNGVSLWFPNTEAAPEVLRMEGLASRRDLVAGRALRRHLDAGERAAWLAARRRRRTCACPAIPSKTRSLSWSHDGLVARRPRAPTPRSSGRSSARRARWARRRANAASAPPRSSRVAFHPGRAGAGHRLRGRLRAAVPPDRRLRAAGARKPSPAAARSPPSPGTGRASACCSAPRRRGRPAHAAPA